MKISSRLDGSICGAILSNRPTTWTSPGLVSKAFDDNSQSRRALSRTRRELHTSAPRRHAGYNGLPDRCPRTSSWLLSTFTPALPAHPRPAPFTIRAPGVRSSHVAAAVATASDTASTPRILNRRELLSLVDYQEAGTVEEHLVFVQDPYLRRYAQPDGPNLRISDRIDDVRYPSLDQTISGDEETAAIVQRLAALCVLRLRHPRRVTLETIHKLYLTLPEERMLHLPAPLRYRLLRAMGTPGKRDVPSMLRYLALVTDVKNSGLTLRRVEWNYALAYASRYVGTATGSDLETTLRLWKEMERDAGIKGNDVTFNILFDVASKSGNFTLAEMIYKEMESRGFKFNRYHHVSLIHFFGLKMDSDGVRAAYKEMVDSGEMVDTVVLNCVISGLLRCGEDSAAEQVYERMKASHTTTSQIPERDYVMSRVVTKVLMMFSKVGKSHPSMVSSFQDTSTITPDLHTYRLLVNHFGVKVGDLNKVAQFLDEMKWFQVPLHGAIFLGLFKGFQTHGGISASTWSEQRLQSVFSALLQALDDGARGLHIDTWLALYALKAFRKCSTEDAVMEAYDALKERWKLDASQEEFMKDALHSLVTGERSRGG